MTDTVSAGAPAMPVIARAVDLYHGGLLVDHSTPMADFAALKQAGIWGLIHKATQGVIRLGSASAGIAQRHADGRIEILDPQHGSSGSQHSERQGNWQARDLEEGRKIAFCAFAVDHNRPQDCIRNAGRTNGLFGSEF
jgi:hypothetical protein